MDPVWHRFGMIFHVFSCLSFACFSEWHFHDFSYFGTQAGFQKPAPRTPFWHPFSIFVRPCSGRVSLNVPWLVSAQFWFPFNSILVPFWLRFGFVLAPFWFPFDFLGSFSRVPANSAVAGPRLCRAKY